MTGYAPLGAPTPVDTRRATAWLQRQIVFEHQRLDEVAAEFNRYGHVPVVIEDADLRGIRLSGQLDAYDTASFAVFLGTLDGVAVEKTAVQYRVYKANRPVTMPAPGAH